MIPRRWITLYFGGTTFVRHEGWIEGCLPDGLPFCATPHDDEESRARAASLGYADVLAMTMEHDPTHAMVCDVLGLSESPALRAAALGREPTEADRELREAEECAVLAVQRLLNVCRRTGLLR